MRIKSYALDETFLLNVLDILEQTFKVTLIKRSKQYNNHIIPLKQRKHFDRIEHSLAIRLYNIV